jgi:hypothetical protein
MCPASANNSFTSILAAAIHFSSKTNMGNVSFRKRESNREEGPSKETHVKVRVKDFPYISSRLPYPYNEEVYTYLYVFKEMEVRHQDDRFVKIQFTDQQQRFVGVYDTVSINGPLYQFLKENKAHDVATWAR